MPRRAAAGEAATPGAEHSSAGAQHAPSSRQYTRGAEHGSQRRVHDRGAGPGSKRATPHGEAAGGAATPGAKHRSAGARNAPTSRWDTREAERGSRRRRGASVRHADPESPAIHPPSVLPTPLAPRCPAGRRTTKKNRMRGAVPRSAYQADTAMFRSLVSAQAVYRGAEGGGAARDTFRGAAGAAPQRAARAPRGTGVRHHE